MITNDTGPMHIAFALKTKTVSLFGPCSPQQYGGIENTTTIYLKVASYVKKNSKDVDKTEL
jgi:ADP-heptose:LPS heptosyltransferase